MTRTLTVALVALALAGGSIAATSSAKADSVTVTTSVDPGGVAFGYDDGYWDRSHGWHTWPITRRRFSINRHRTTIIMAGSTTAIPTRGGANTIPIGKNSHRSNRRSEWGAGLFFRPALRFG